MNASTKGYAQRTMADVVGSLRSAEGQCVVLIGAGCSLSGGIPLASTLVQQIRQRFPEAHQRARDSRPDGAPDYNQVMEQLSPNQRQALLNGYIDGAQINWAHLALAQLLKLGKIDRVLTVNFDTLLMKACAFVNFYPAIYDLAGSSHFKRHRIAPKAVFYLNGQHTGFVTLNATDELEAHRAKLRAVVEETGVKRLWLVLGYSGEADPLCEALAEQASFDGDFYWLGYEAEPSRRLIDSGLFGPGRHAFYVGGQDADASLKELAQKLECFPPVLLTKPIQHIQDVITSIRFESGGEEARVIEQNLLKLLSDAARLQTAAASRDGGEAKNWLLAGDYQRVLDAFAGLDGPDEHARELAAWAHVMLGNAHEERARAALAAAGSATADAATSAAFAKARQRYAAALAVKGDMHQAANNWGLALSGEARSVRLSDLAAARRLWTQAGEKYALALSIKPDRHESAYNWGIALADEANATQSADLEAARWLWKQASEKFALALAIQPDKYAAAYGWALALVKEGKAVQADDLATARQLWAQAGDKFSLALSIKPDSDEAAYSWGSVLDDEAQAVWSHDLAAARRLWARAGEMYALALSIKPNDDDAANSAGVALANEARALRSTDGAVAGRLWAQAYAKYALALSIKPASGQAAYNWAIALADEAQAVQPLDAAAARRLWAQAGEKLKAVLLIDPQNQQALLNLGIALANEAQAVQTADLGTARQLWAQAREQYAQALALKPDDCDSLNHWGITLENEAQAVHATDLVAARQLWQQAGEKYAKAISIEPGRHEAAENWAVALLNEARAIPSDDLETAIRLCAEAAEKYAQVLSLKPDAHDAASNWGGALIISHHMVRAGDPQRAAAQLREAVSLLERQAALGSAARDNLAYNLACAYALSGRLDEALAQLEVSRRAGLLPAHWATDNDLQALRGQRAYLDWFQAHFANRRP